MAERTFFMIKPDAVRAWQIGAILHCLEKHYFELERMEMRVFPHNKFVSLYKEHFGKDFHKNLLDFSTSGPAVACVVTRSHGMTDEPPVVSSLRKLVGATQPKEAAAGTLRAEFGTNVPANAVHASADEEAAEREIALFFGE